MRIRLLRRRVQSCLSHAFLFGNDKLDVIFNSDILDVVFNYEGLDVIFNDIIFNGIIFNGIIINDRPDDISISMGDDRFC